MEIFKEIGALKAFLQGLKRHPVSIGFVPTMGALHEGHLALVRKSKEENELTVCSIYINPTQFNNPTDLEMYPRTIDRDQALLDHERCDVLFLPDNSVMYPHPSALTFDFGQLDKTLEGKFRTGHFSGVALVVSKLFNIIRPTKAYFGQKDYQQFLIISKLTEELKFELTLTCFPIVRERDGLAMSSRNQRLTDQGRKDASILYRSLKEAQEQLLQNKPWAEVTKAIEEKVHVSGLAKLEYLALADRKNLIPLESVTPENLSSAILLIAAYVEDVRLIDNLFVADLS